MKHVENPVLGTCWVTLEMKYLQVANRVTFWIFQQSKEIFLACCTDVVFSSFQCGQGAAITSKRSRDRSNISQLTLGDIQILYQWACLQDNSQSVDGASPTTVRRASPTRIKRGHYAELLRSHTVYHLREPSELAASFALRSLSFAVSGDQDTRPRSSRVQHFAPQLCVKRQRRCRSASEIFLRASRNFQVSASR
ncbi:hypothetical protein JG688_00005172 [Phytophthora aleatoria]|uniref:Uncharacterized protein n=1 Tax=Phytophthora aleatoria TaxID=2496075 RepID=A0A8J5MH15_9STRA|nr:hypothetical protein JG688_00005172 [Phytophthora aleatoria]